MKKIYVFLLIGFMITELKAQTVTDYDGNVYNTVTIGTQTWMAENLKTTHYADGTAIPLVTGNSNWDTLDYTDKAYCWYDDDSATNANTYGALYTWSAAMNGAASSSSSPSGIQGVCPAGWHLPSNAEWTELTDYLGRAVVAGGKLKDTTHWVGTNEGATNESGFTALPGGHREYDGSFHLIGIWGIWWSSTESSSSSAWYRNLRYDSRFVFRNNYYLQNGFSVRCVSDIPATMVNFLNIDESILYPNPATERLYVKNSNYANATIKIFDLQGKQVLTRQIDSESIDISNLRKGIYVVKVVRPENIMITKFIKE
jgi:uncharacterized protein (TIGR02145 family)